MKTIVFLLLGFFTCPTSPTVYVCYSPTAKKYHLSEKCRGLNACEHEIKKMSMAEAKAEGWEKCGWED